jgi:hypothetical protein
MPNSLSSSSNSHEGFRRLKIVLVVLLELPVALFILLIPAVLIQGMPREAHPGLISMFVCFVIIAAIIPACVYASSWPRRISVAALLLPPVMVIAAGTRNRNAEELGFTLLKLLLISFAWVAVSIGLAWGGVWVFKWVTKGFRTG